MSSVTTIEESAKEIWDELAGEPEKSQFILERIISVYEQSSKDYLKFNYIFFIFSVIEFILISTAPSKSEIEFFGFKLIDANIHIIEWIITSGLCIIYYQSLVSMSWFLIHYMYFAQYVEKYFPNAVKEELVEVISPPSFITYELFMMLRSTNLVSIITVLSIFIILMVIPIMVIFAFMATIIFNAYLKGFLMLKVFLVILDLVFISRSLHCIYLSYLLGGQINENN